MNEFLREIQLKMQEEEWTCGLACVSMALDSLFGENDKWKVDELKKMVLNFGSVWTIELALILNGFGAKIKFYSTYFGAKQEHKEIEFYRKDFDKEEKMINELFSKINSEKRFEIIRSRIDSNELKKEILEKKSLILVLIDAKKITCSHCAIDKNENEQDIDEENDDDDFLGHFILVNGFKSNRFIYVDPSSDYFVSPQYCSMEISDFDNARFSKGTDEDLIIIQFQ